MRSFPGSPVKEADESKEFFELVQQFMAEYTASAKVGGDAKGKQSRIDIANVTSV